jgi:CBS domain containing-hemolysin-like protein
MTALILYFALALGVSFICSLLEAVTLSLTYSYIAALGVKSPRSSSLLKQIKSRIDRALSAILTLNTIANTIGAVGVGAQVVKLWGDAYLGVASAALTLMILVLSEIIPKTLGAVHWRRLAPTAAYGIFGLIWLLKYPINFLEIVSRPLVPKGRRRLFSREEMMASVQMGIKEGVLWDQEGRVIQNMLYLNTLRVKDILTPRTVVLALPKRKTIAEVVDEQSPLRFSRIPVYDKDVDDVIGVIHRHSLMQLLSDGKGNKRLGSIAVPIHAVPNTKSVASTLEEFINRKEHIFLVVDEYGGTAGIVTLEDAIETLLGAEIVDEFDRVQDMRKLALRLAERYGQKWKL